MDEKKIISFEKLSADFKMYNTLSIKWIDILLNSLETTKYTMFLTTQMNFYSKYIVKELKKYSRSGVDISRSIREFNSVFFELARPIYPQLVEGNRPYESNVYLLDTLLCECKANLQLSEPGISELCNFIFTGSTIVPTRSDDLLDNSVFAIEGLMKMGNSLRVDMKIPLWETLDEISMSESDVFELFTSRPVCISRLLVQHFKKILQHKSGPYYQIVLDVLNCASVSVMAQASAQRCSSEQRNCEIDLRSIRKACIQIRQSTRLSPKDILYVCIEGLPTKVQDGLASELQALNIIVCRLFEESVDHLDVVLLSGDQIIFYKY